MKWQVEVVKERIELVEVEAETSDDALDEALTFPGVVRVNKIIHKGMKCEED